MGSFYGGFHGTRRWVTNEVQKVSDVFKGHFIESKRNSSRIQGDSEGFQKGYRIVSGDSPSSFASIWLFHEIFK